MDIDLAKSHTIKIKELFNSLSSSPDGLGNAEAEHRLAKYGKNKLSEKKEKPIIVKFLLQFNNFFSYLLLFGSLLSFVSEWLLPGQGSIYVAWALLGVTVLNAVFTFIQEFKAERAMKSFKNLMTSTVVVIRDGKKQQIDSADLVIGDIMVLSEGDKVTADARIIEQEQLKVDHSALTGESEPQLRSVDATSKNILLSRNMVFSGTLVQSGMGKAVVVATGDKTQIGTIAQLTHDVQNQVSHLQVEIAHFIKIISYIAIFLGISFFLMGWLFKDISIWTMLVFGIGIIVANVPEGLLPTVTLTLSISAQRMAKHNVLIKNIDAIETLGSLTIICSDKTGTLTENNLHVNGFYIDGRFYSFNRQDKHIYEGKNQIRIRSIKGSAEFNDILLLCNNSVVNESKEFGDSTEICLKRFVSNFSNLNYIEKAHQRVHEVPFSSETKYMITVNRFDKNERAHLKGAPEVVLAKCNRIFQNGKFVKLTAASRKKILAENESYSRKGFRVLGCALKDINWSKKNAKKLDIDDYCFYGLIIMQDPPRKEVPDAVAQCKKAGIRIIVISGDQGTTVENIARQVGIVDDGNVIVINGPDLPNYSDDELKKILREKQVLFARALPIDKLRIVTLLKDMGEIVAVTGDGVNDAPALKKSDVGIAMGKSGTEVAKDAADMILLDDNFASIVKAIKSGRTVYDNIKNFITYILTSNTPEIVPFLFFILFGWPLALPVLLILCIDLGTDMLPAIGLGMEKPSDDIMKRPPRSKTSKLLNWKMIARSYGFIGPLQTAFSYIVFFSILMNGGWTWGMPIQVTDKLYMSAITAFLATIVITQMFNVFACRTSRLSVFSKGIFSNKFILIGLLSEAILMTIIATVPHIQMIFGTWFFPIHYLLWMIGFGMIILLVEELRKLIDRRFGIFGIEN
ncbi:cation-transporting P-type ATPase [Candidatus Woesearchaeota archaeon]|nr:cation-transporting P-type ATPase [Candidatus Woesearchaeota archaeon]